ncbi:MAG: hypothetical protein MZU97_03340, partial [Bacillus subtilis]|nr:hypothetical protein [Bacillus subtilis]
MSRTLSLYSKNRFDLSREKNAEKNEIPFPESSQDREHLFHIDILEHEKINLFPILRSEFDESFVDFEPGYRCIGDEVDPARSGMDLEHGVERGPEVLESCVPVTRLTLAIRNFERKYG